MTMNSLRKEIISVLFAVLYSVRNPMSDNGRYSHTYYVTALQLVFN